MNQLYEELSFPSATQLHLAARRRGIPGSKEDAQRIATRNPVRQVIAPVQRSKGQTAAEDDNARWQMDLAEIRKDNKAKEKFALVVSNVFDRKLYVEPLLNKKPITVVEALKRIKAPKPYTVSTDRGTEFLNPNMEKYLDSINVKHRYKEEKAPNSLAVVDRGIQLLKQKLANIQGNTGMRWGESLQKAASAVNNTHKQDVLHGASPNEVADDENVKFMLYQDNAMKLQHNQGLIKKKQESLGTAFRPPLTTDRRFRRSWRPAYGEVQTVDSVEGGIVRSGNQNYDINLIQPVPSDSREIMPARRLRVRNKSTN